MQSKKKQRGMTFFGLILTAVVIVFAGLVVIQAVPTYTEYLTIQKAVEKSAGGETVSEIRGIFDRAATIDSIDAIAGKDLQISKVAGKVVVSYAYSREIHLFGPAYLVMKYEGASK